MSRRNHSDLIGSAVVEPEVSLDLTKPSAVAGGVTVEWLVRVFRMSRYHVEKRLSQCPTIGTGRYGAPLYDLPEAASYLVVPRVDLESYISNLKPDQLPEKWRESYWNAALKRQKWELNARDLWRTSDVLNVLAELFGTVRTSLQLIPDRVERAVGLTVKQRGVVTEVVDDIQADLHAKLVSVAEQRETPSQAAEEEFDFGEDE